MSKHYRVFAYCDKNLTGQRGVSLVMVLLSLLLMSIAAIGLIRTVDSGSMIVGNVSFKQAATAAADHGMVQAIQWLQTNGSTSNIDTDMSDAGYHASMKPELDVVGATDSSDRVLIDWESNQCANAVPITQCLSTAGLSNEDEQNIGHSVRYVIIRQCEGPGPHNTWALRCARPQMVSSASGSRAAGSYETPGTPSEATPSQVFYRIIVRSAGARNTVSFTEAYVNF